MGIPTTLVGTRSKPIVHDVDARWTMAYAASLGDTRPDYLDTTRPAGVVAHPVFVVAPEWPAIVALRDESLAHGLTADQVRTSVHATHDTTIHRLIRPGDRLTTTAETTGLVNKRPGAMSTMAVTTVDAVGSPVATTTQRGIYLGQPLVGDDHPDPNPPEPLLVPDRSGTPVCRSVGLGGEAAHVYTECARIWNPIHTDQAVAQRAGLPGIILHGTANLAHGVSAVVDLIAGGRPDRVRRIACRFSAMVELPSTIEIRVWAETAQPDGSSTVAFEVLNAAGQPAVSDGVVVLGVS